MANKNKKYSRYPVYTPDEGDNSPKLEYNDTYIYGIDRQVKTNYDKLQEYQTRRQNNEYISSDELATYRKARTDYGESSRRLNNMTRATGGTVDVAQDKQRYDWLNALDEDFGYAESIANNFKSADEYSAAVKDAGYRDKYAGKSYSELTNELTGLNARIKAPEYTRSQQNGGYIPPERFRLTEQGEQSGVLTLKNEPVQDTDKLVEEYEWLNNYISTDRDVIESMTLEELELYRVKNGYKASENPVLYYDNNGTAVTVDGLIAMKQRENELEAIRKDGYASAAYEELMRRDNFDVDLGELSDFMWYTANGTGGVNAESILRETPEWKKYKALADANGLDLNKSVAEVTEDIERAERDIEGYKERLEKAGYDWAKHKEYNKYVYDRNLYAAKQAEAEEYGREHPLDATVTNIITSPFQAVDLVENLGENKTGLVNIYDDDIVNSISARQKGVTEKIDESIDNDVVSWLATTAYSGVTSSLQSAATAAASTFIFGPVAGPSISLGILGSQAAASSFNEAIKNGSTNGEALSTAIIAGVAEAAFEKLPLDNLFSAAKALDTSSVKKLIWSGIKQTGKQALIEGLEEAGTNIVNTIADGIINGDHSQYNTTVEKLVREGYTREEAQQMAAVEWLKEFAGDFVGGMFGGMASGTMANVSGVVRNYGKARFNNKLTKSIGLKFKSDNSSYDGLVKAAKLMPDNTEVQKALKAVNRKDSDVNVGNLVYAVGMALTKEFGAAQSIDTLNDIKSKYGDNNGYVNGFYARGYERITGEDYSAPDNAVLQSDASGKQKTAVATTKDAVPEYDSFTRSDKGISYDATTIEGKKIKIYAVDTETGKIATSDGIIDATAVRNDLRGVDRILNKAVQYESEKAELYVAGYEGGSDTTLYDYVFNGIYGEGRLINYGTFEAAWKKYGEYGALSRNAAEVIYDAARAHTANERNKSIEKAMYKKGVASGKITGKFRSRELNELVKAVAVRFGVDIEITKLNDGVNAQFVPNEGKILVNKNVQSAPKALFHELMEAVLAYHASSAMEIQDVVIDYYTEVKGTEFVNEQIENYRSDYEVAEGSKTLSEAKAELVNDAVGELFTTEDGMREFCEWLTDTDKIIDRKKKNLLENFKKALEGILDFFKRFLSGSVPINSAMREIAEMEQERATAIRKQVLEAFHKVTETMKNGNTEENNVDKYEKEIRNSINVDFYKKFDKWVNAGASDTHTAFILGNTSEVLQNIGVKNQTIKLFSGTIVQKINKHPEISVDCFRKIPELLENPIIVQYSDDIDPQTNKQKYDTRITILGNLYDKNGKNPVLVPLELIPLSRKNKPLEYILVVSEHIKENLQHYISNNSLLYVNPNKKVTNSWLKLNRLSLPLSSANYGYIRSITYSNGKVKIQNPKNKTAMQAAFEKAGLVDEYGNIIDKTEKNDTRSSIEVKDKGELHEDVIRENGVLEDIIRDVYKAYSMAEGVEISEDACRRIADTLITRTNSLVKPEQISKDIYWLFREASGIRTDSGQIPFDLFTRQCEDIARKLVRHSNNNEKIDPTIEAALLEMKEKSVKLSDEQIKVIGKRYKSVKSFLARNRYPFKINKNADVSITEFWNEMKDKYPQIFSEDVAEEMIPIAFADIAFSYGDTYMDGYGFSTSDAVAVVASEMQMLFIDAVNEVKNGGVGQSVLSAIETDRKRLDAVKERYRKLTREMRNYYEDLGQTELISRKVRYTQQKRTSEALHTKREIRVKIKKSTDRIKSLLDHPTQNKYVPVSIMETVKQALDIMEADGFRSRDEIVRMASRIKKVLVDNEVTLGPRSGDAKKAFEKLQDVAYEESSNVWGLDEYELVLTYRAYRSLEKAILNEVQAIEGEKSRKAHDLAEQCIDDMGKDRKTAATIADNLARKNVVTRLLFGNGFVKAVSRIPYAARKVALSECMSPEDVFDSFGCYRKGNIWRSLFKVVQDGEVKKQKIAMDANEIFSDLLDTKKYRKDIAKLNDEVDLGVKSRQDEPIKITRNMMLYIKLLLMNTDSRQTIEKGGMSLPDLFELKKGNFSKAFANKDRTTGSGFDIANAEREIRRLIALESRTEEQNNKLKELRESFEGIKLKRETDVGNLERMIDSVMTDYEKMWIKTAYEFFNGFSKDIINEASVIRFGYEIADMENYCPKIVDTAFIGGMSFEGFMNDALPENMGFTKERIHSRAPIKVIGLTDVIQDHIEKISLYGGLMNPIHDFNSIYNAQFKGHKESVKNRLGKVFGDWATKYIDNLMNDLVGNRPAMQHFEQANKLLGKLRGNVASSALVLNFPNVMEQYSSYWNAASVIGYGNLVKACFESGKNGWMFSRADRDLIKQYTPILENRYEGMGNVELGDIMKQKKWVGTSWGQKMIRTLATLNARADAGTAGRLWYAAEYKVQEQYPELYEAAEINPEAYYTKIAEVYERAMLRTQAGYNVTQRPELLRTNNEVVKSLSMFMTERLKNSSLCIGSTARLWSAIKDKSDVREAFAEWAVTNSSLIISSAVGQLLHTLMRLVLHKIDDDERDEVTGEVTIETLFHGYYIGTIERLVGNFWGGSEIYNAVKSIKTGERYYGPSINGVDFLLDGISSFVDLGTKAADDKKRVTGDELWRTAKETASGMGFPARNVETIIKGAMEHFVDFKNGEFLSFKAGFEISDKECLSEFVDLVEDEKYEKAKGYVSGWVNEKTVELAEKDGYKKKDVSGYIKAKYRKDAESAVRGYFNDKYKDEYIKAYKAGDVKGVKKIRVVLYNTGLYDVDEQFASWRKADFEAEYKEAYKNAYYNGDTKTMADIEKKGRDGEFYDKPADTFKRWRKAVDELKEE